jgi:hypothetical protein
MPLTIFSIKGLSGNRREHIEAAVVAGGKHARGPHEGWIAVEPRGTVRVLITLGFAPDEDVAVIGELVRATLEE